MKGTKCITGLLWAIGVAVAASTIACGDTPTLGTPTSPEQPRTTNRLSGTVTELLTGGRSPVEGAVVTHVATGRSATTDSSGGYSIAEIPPGMATIMATKDGYEDATGLVAVSGETRLDLQLVRRGEPFPPAALSGLVYERTAAGQVPVPGVTVEDSNFHFGSVTGADGRYRIDYSRLNLGLNYVANLYIAKEGFQPTGGAVAIRGETLLDIEMVRR